MADESDDMQRLQDLVQRQQRLINNLTQLVHTNGVSHSTPASAVYPTQQADVAEPPPARAESGLRDSPVDWTRVSGAERVAAWHGLFQFVLDIVDRYNMQFEVRPCWWLHADAVEELTALWHIRQWCYRPNAGLDTAGTWLDNLHKSRDRLRLVFPSCRQEHVEPGRPPWMTAEVSRAFCQYVEREASADQRES